MCVVVHDIEPVYPCARKDHAIRDRHDHAGCAAAIGELNRLPRFGFLIQAYQNPWPALPTRRTVVRRVTASVR